MAKIPLYAADGVRKNEIEASNGVFDAPLREHLVHTAVVAYLANQRRGQARVKTRSEVRGGGKKPWRQKGTGRARAGTINSPLWRHGGVAHGPKQRDYSVNIPRKMLKNALCSMLTSMARDGRIMVMEEISFDKPGTKKASGIIRNLKLKGNILFLVDRPDENFIKSLRNLNYVRFQDPMSLNVYDVACSEYLVTFRESLKLLEKRLEPSAPECGESAE